MIKILYAQFMFLINFIKYTRASQNNALNDKCCYYCEADIVDGIKFDQKDTAQTKLFYENFMDYINFNSLEPNLLSIFCTNNSKPNTTHKRKNFEPENDFHRTKKFKSKDKTLNLENAIDLITNGTTSVNNATKNDRVEPENKKYRTYICNLCRKKLNINDSCYSNHQKFLIHHSKNKILKIDPSPISDSIHLNIEFAKANNNFINSFVQKCPENLLTPSQKQDETKILNSDANSIQGIENRKSSDSCDTISSQKIISDSSEYISQKSSENLQHMEIENHLRSVNNRNANLSKNDNALVSSAELKIHNQNRMNTSDLKNESGFNVSFEKLDETFVSLNLKNAKFIIFNNITIPKELIDIKLFVVQKNFTKQDNPEYENVLDDSKKLIFILLIKNFNKFYAKHDNSIKKLNECRKVNKQISNGIYLKERNPENSSINVNSSMGFENMSNATKLRYINLKTSDEIIFEEDVKEKNSILEKIINFYSECPEDAKNDFMKILESFETKEQEAMKKFYEFFGNIKKKRKLATKGNKESKKKQLNLNETELGNNNNINTDQTDINKEDKKNFESSRKAIKFCNASQKYKLSDDRYAHFFAVKYKIEFFNEFEPPKFDLGTFIENKFENFQNEINFCVINENTDLLLKSRMFNFDYFLKLSKSLSHLYNFEPLEETDLNRVLCNIIENNLLSVRIVIPQCLFYSNYMKVFELKGDKNFINDYLSHIYFLNIFELFLKIDWNQFFQYLSISIIIARHKFLKIQGSDQQFFMYLRFNHEVLYLRYLFFMRFRFEINKIFMFLASPFLEAEIYEKYVILANFDKIYLFTTLNKFTFSRCNKKGIFLAKNYVTILSPLFFATICKPINLKNSQIYFENFEINKKSYSLPDIATYCKFCDHYDDIEKYSFRHKYKWSFLSKKCIDYKNILFYMMYFKKIKNFNEKYVQDKIANWIMSVEKCFEFESDDSTKLVEVLNKRIQLSEIEKKSTFGFIHRRIGIIRFNELFLLWPSTFRRRIYK
ncbi:hypothetical protein GVAV_001553 [Gurleya vavrai]